MSRLNYKLLFFCTCIIALQSCGKKTTETKPVIQDVTETVFASGVLEAEGTYQLTAKTEGYLLEVNFNEGDDIAVGKVLARIDNKENIFNTQSAAQLFSIAETNTQYAAPALQQAEQALIIAKQKAALDAVQLERYQRLWKANSVSKIDLDNAELQYKNALANIKSAAENVKLLQQQARQQLISNRAQKQVTQIIAENNLIKAVAPGKVLKKYKEKGDFVKKGDVIAQIGNTGEIYAKISVDETNIDRIQLGQEALLSLNINREKIYRARVKEILPAFDEATQSFFCKLTFTDTLTFTVVGTQLQCNVQVAHYKNALLIPRQYLDYSGCVMVKGNKTPQKVVTGFLSNQWVQILKGIDANTTIVTDNLAENNIQTSEAGSQMR
jgi:HlyD family secretion protein